MSLFLFDIKQINMITDKLKNTGKRAIGKGDPRNSEHSDGGPDKVKYLKRSKMSIKSSP